MNLEGYSRTVLASFSQSFYRCASSPNDSPIYNHLTRHDYASSINPNERTLTRYYEEKRQRKIAIENSVVSTIPAIAATIMLSGLFVDSNDKLLITSFVGFSLFFLAGWLKCMVTGEDLFSGKKNL